MILPEAGEFLVPATAIDGFRLGCLIDASTGMVLGSVQNADAPDSPTAAAGAADIVSVLTLLSGKVATGEILEDVMITFSDNFFMVRAGRAPGILEDPGGLAGRQTLDRAHDLRPGEPSCGATANCPSRRHSRCGIQKSLIALMIRMPRFYKSPKSGHSRYLPQLAT